MKLKLENQNEVTILVVTESIELGHIPVLKAGLTKLFQSGKKSILLDFSLSKKDDIKDPAVHQQLLGLGEWAHAFGAQIVNVATVSGIGQVGTRTEGLKLLSSPLEHLAAIENSLRARLKELEKKKSELTEKLTRSQANDPKKIQRENSSLKKNLLQAEKTAKSFFKQRTRDPLKVPSVEIQREKLEQLLNSFLKNEGVLK